MFAITCAHLDFFEFYKNINNVRRNVFQHLMVSRCWLTPLFYAATSGAARALVEADDRVTNFYS